MTIQDQRNENSRRRTAPKMQRINEHIRDYDQHFEDLKSIGISGMELMNCAGRFINTFWIE